MLRVRAFDKVAVWNYPGGLWQCDSETERKTLQAHFDRVHGRTMSPRDLLVEGGPSGIVWKALREEFGDAVELLELAPEPEPVEEPGVLY